MRRECKWFWLILLKDYLIQIGPAFFKTKCSLEALPQRLRLEGGWVYFCGMKILEGMTVCA